MMTDLIGKRFCYYGDRKKVTGKIKIKNVMVDTVAFKTSKTILLIPVIFIFSDNNIVYNSNDITIFKD